jgi:hypothetical protein
LLEDEGKRRAFVNLETGLFRNSALQAVNATIVILKLRLEIWSRPERILGAAVGPHSPVRSSVMFTIQPLFFQAV